MKGLADAGHDVTVISAYENKLPILNGSYKDYILTGYAEDYQSKLKHYFLFIWIHNLLCIKSGHNYSNICDKNTNNSF